MNCRENCGACCIAPSICTEIEGVFRPKPANTVCEYLAADMSCRIYEQRPAVCRNFEPCPEYCGSSREEALSFISRIEELTKPDKQKEKSHQ